MGIVAGQGATIQIGAQSNWSTPVAPTVQVEFVSESLEYLPNLITPDQITGKAGADRMDISGIKVEGSIDMVVNPHNAAMLLSAALGAEADAAAVDSSAVYDHVFTPISASVSSSLPKVTITVDRVQAIKGYVGCKVDNFNLSADVEDYLKATWNFRGYDEVTDTLAVLSQGEKKPFMFLDGTLQFDSTNYDEVVSMRMSYGNNLEDRLFVLNGSNKMIEIEPQKREITFEIEALYSSDTESLRENAFKAQTPVNLTLTFESSEAVLTGKYYTLTIDAQNCYITRQPTNVGGPERIRTQISLMATEQGGDPLVTITLRDGVATKHIT